METALNGGELSSEEQERLNTELPKRIMTQYNNMQNLRLADDDERILEELKNHFLMKQQALKDMRQAAVDEAQQAEAAQQEAETAQDADEVANKAAEADMIAKVWKGWIRRLLRKPAYEEASGGSMSGTAGDTAVSGEEKAADHQRVLNYDTNNQDNIDEIEDLRSSRRHSRKKRTARCSTRVMREPCRFLRTRNQTSKSARRRIVSSWTSPESLPKTGRSPDT